MSLDDGAEVELVTSRFRFGEAPSPTGYLHLGHARTFLIAAQRAVEAGGTLVLRNEDLDPDRCRREYVEAIYQDLRCRLGIGCWRDRWLQMRCPHPALRKREPGPPGTEGSQCACSSSETKDHLPPGDGSW